MASFDNAPPSPRSRPRAAASMFLPPRLAAALLPKTREREDFLRWLGLIGLFTLLTFGSAALLAQCTSCQPETGPESYPVLALRAPVFGGNR